MSDQREGYLWTGELPDGRFVAASSCSPYLCVTAESEEAVLEKVRKAVTFYQKAINVTPPPVRRKSVSTTVTTIVPQRRISFTELMAA